MDLPSELKHAFVARPVDANKYSVGTVTVVGGSVRYAHAPVIAALGARAAGAGLVQLVAPDESRSAAGAHVPEATFTRLEAACEPPLADVTVVGMGLGASERTEELVGRLLSGTKGRFVVDADALTVLASWCGRAGGFRPGEGQEIVVTPHEGEAARLLGWTKEKIREDRLVTARAIAGRYGATVVLKGPKTLVVSPDGLRVYKNLTGNPVLAMGGAGDLLAGALGARWAYLKGDPFLAAASSVWLHGAAADAVVAEARDPSIANIAAEIGALRVRLVFQ